MAHTDEVSWKMLFSGQPGEKGSHEHSMILTSTLTGTTMQQTHLTLNNLYNFI